MESPKCCANCQVTFRPFWACGRCRKVRYCSEVCQAAHWKEHKPNCYAATRSIYCVHGFQSTENLVDSNQLVHWDETAMGMGPILPCGNTTRNKDLMRTQLPHDGDEGVPA